MGGPEAAGMAQDNLEHMKTATNFISEFFTVVKAITSNVVGTIDAALAHLDNEEIKLGYEVMTILQEILEVAQLADDFFVKVEDFFHMESESLAATMIGLKNSQYKDTNGLSAFMDQLKARLVEYTEKCKELENACQRVITTCKGPAEMCASKERDCHRYRMIYVPGVFVVGAAVGVYVALQADSIATRIVAAMILVGMCICAYFIFGVLKKSGESFQEIRGRFDNTIKFACQTKMKVIKSHGTLERCSEQIGYINFSVMRENPVMMKDTLARFKDVCAKCCTIISQCKHKVKDKLKKFQRRQSVYRR